MSPNIEAFWQAYLASLPAGQNPPSNTYDAWGFGDSPEMADNLGLLVKNGIKTATCSLVWESEAEGESPPYAGQMSIILAGNGDPLCIIETIEVEIKPYNEVDAQFAYHEGEGDRSLAYWREAHWGFFSRVCQRLDLEPSLTMPLYCERFRVVYPK